jgi:hypothetical protein
MLRLWYMEASSQTDSEGIPNLSQWSDLEKTSKEAIKERKIKVTFLPAQGSTPQPADVNGVVSLAETIKP